MKNNLMPLIVVLILLFACNTATKKEEPKLRREISVPQQPKKKHTELDSIRNSIAEVYGNIKERQNVKKGLLKNVSTVSNSNLPYTPCDINYLVYLNGKSDYTLKEVKKLLCLDNHDECDDNVEFIQFYNEIIFKVFNRERDDFTDAQIIALLKDEELIEELLNPTQGTRNDNLLKALREDALNPNN